MKTIQRGFTIIELLIAFAILGILAALMYPVANKDPNRQYSVVAGEIETRCINGYSYVITRKEVSQTLDQFGKGVPCRIEENVIAPNKAD